MLTASWLDRRCGRSPVRRCCQTTSDLNAVRCCRTDFAHPLAAQVDLHNLNAPAAKAALIVWLRFLKFHLQKNGTREPFGPGRRHAFIVTGAPRQMARPRVALRQKLAAVQPMTHHIY